MLIATPTTIKEKRDAGYLPRSGAEYAPASG